MKKIITIFSLVASIAISGLAQAGDPTDLGLTQVKDSKHQSAFLKADHDFSKYDAIAIADIETEGVEVHQPTKSRLQHGNKWEMTEERQARVQEAYNEAFNEELSELDSMELVDSVDANTLVLVTRMREVAPAVGYDTQNIAGRARSFSESSGAAIIDIVLLDGGTGEIVAFVASSRNFGSHWARNDSVTNGSNVRLAFNGWAKMAAKAIDNLPETAGDARG